VRTRAIDDRGRPRGAARVLTHVGARRSAAEAPVPFSAADTDVAAIGVAVTGWPGVDDPWWSSPAPRRGGSASATWRCSQPWLRTC